MLKTNAVHVASSAIALLLVAIVPYLPVVTIAQFQTQGAVASTTFIIAVVCAAALGILLINYVLKVILKLTINYVAHVVQLLICVISIGCIHASSYLTWWLPLGAFAALIVLLQSNEWTLYKWKNSLAIRKINHLLLNEFLEQYNVSVHAVYVATTAQHNELMYSRGKAIIVLTNATNNLGETHVNHTALRLLSIAKTRNVTYGINFSLLIQFALFMAASYVYNFNYLLITQCIGIVAMYCLLSNVATILLANMQQRFELVYDIMLYDNIIDPTLFKEFIINTYGNTNADKRLYVIHHMEESQLVPYALATHVAHYNVGLMVGTK